MVKFFTLIIIFVLSSKFITAQENYIEHSIKKGESVYVISQRYGVSMNAIFNLNPGSENIIYAGRTLRVPTVNSTANTTTISDTRITNYEVKRGETKSGLARRFGVSISMLEQQNPQIRNMLQAGHILNVDKTIREEKRTAANGEYIVTKGETLWGIARQNGISLEQLTAANANRLSEYLQIGQPLIIPDKNFATTNTGTYLVKRGDTKFELAKRFNLTIAELEAKNPNIVNMLMAGDTIKIDGDITTAVNNNTIATVGDNSEEPNTDDPSSIERTTTQVDTIFSHEDSPNYKAYVIQPKETLFGLSQKAGMTIEAFTNLNPKLKNAVNAGDIIKMPEGFVDTDSTTNNNINDLTTTENLSDSKNESLLSKIDTSSRTGIYFYSPFSLEDLNSPVLVKNMLGINPDGQKFLDFYNGALIAMDSARALDLNFDVTLIKQNDARIRLQLETANRKNALLVPFSSSKSNYPEIVANKKFSVIDIESDIKLKDSLIIYKPIASKNFQKTKTLNYLASQNAQITVVSDLKTSKNKALISDIIPDAQFLSVDNAGFFEDGALQKSLDKNKLNYVILDSEKTIVFLNATTSLMKILPDYNIQLVSIEFAEVPEQSEVSNIRYKILKLIFPTAINPNENKLISDFESKYQILFDAEPSRYSRLGFDITLDVIMRLAQNESFENTIKTIKSEQLYTRFDFEKISNNRYSNQNLYIMQYDSNDGLIELNKE